MFFNLVKTNSRRNRKENALFFSSLIITIISFYTILSLENQDVILFLKKMESDAIDKLFLLVPAIYAFSLFILFFLVYFAENYQLNRRNHELGMYLMLGMRRNKLLLMLLIEEIWNSIFSLAIGIPVAVFICEITSLAIAKIVGLGIVGHHFSFSLKAVIGTIIGYIIIRLAALIILCGKFSKKQINQLLSEEQEKKHKETSKAVNITQLVVGVILLAMAYTSGVMGLAWVNMRLMGATIAVGTGGVFLFFRGIGIMFQNVLSKNKNKNGLSIFTFRQVQESVFHKSNTLAISSILIIMAMCCFAFGMAASLMYDLSKSHVLDYTFGENIDVESELEEKDINKYFGSLFEIKFAHYPSYEEDSFSAQGISNKIMGYKDIVGKDTLINNFKYFEHPYLIQLSSYNEILKLSGKEEIVLEGNQVALYNNPNFSYENSKKILTYVLNEGAYVEMYGEKYELFNELCQENLVTDRRISISYGLIISDELYDSLTLESDRFSYWNGALGKDYVEEKGLMQAIMEVNNILNTTDLEYESYLQNMGRSLFYTVAASYITIYLAAIFLVISNTVLGVQFLMQQQKTKKRYQTLIKLGADYKGLCKTARQQINWYYLLPIVVATVSSIFGARTLFTGIATATMRDSVGYFMTISCAMIIFLYVIEFCYMIAVKKISDNNIKNILKVKREDN